MLVREVTSLSLIPAKGSLGRGGGCTGCSRLDRSVGQDAAGELLLGLGEAGTGPPVLRVDLGTRDKWEGGLERFL